MEDFTDEEIDQMVYDHWTRKSPKEFRAALSASMAAYREYELKHKIKKLIEERRYLKRELRAYEEGELSHLHEPIRIWCEEVVVEPFDWKMDGDRFLFRHEEHDLLFRLTFPEYIKALEKKAREDEI